MQPMELKIYNPQDDGFLRRIEWNFEELKVEITAASEEYATSVYTDDTIRNAKADRAKLKKFVDAMEGKRKELKKKVMEPYEQFEQEEKQLVAIVQRAIDNIDSQVKDYERRQREGKTAKVREFYEANIHDIGEYLPFERVFKPEYANATTSMKSIKEEILAAIQKVDEGLAILNEVDSKFAGDMKAVFLRTYDIGAAMAERNRLESEERRREEYMAEQQRRRQEREAREKAEAQEVMQAGMKAQGPTVESPVQQISQQPDKGLIYEMRFCVHGTREQLLQLRDFMKAHNISFEKI